MSSRKFWGFWRTVLAYALLMGTGLSAQEVQSATDTPQDEEAVVAPTGAYSYKPLGRRDPFLDQSVRSQGRRNHREGLAGLYIDELELEGIFFFDGEYLAQFQGPNNRPYVVRVGHEVYDGRVVRIEANTVVFKKMLSVPMGGTKEKLIYKRLNPEEEAISEDEN